tara:strand:+ start:3531 stop:3776 length:246 start_codon:yes stop_codon:yes gene_type:complete
MENSTIISSKDAEYQINELWKIIDNLHAQKSLRVRQATENRKKNSETIHRYIAENEFLKKELKERTAELDRVKRLYKDIKS